MLSEYEIGKELFAQIKNNQSKNFPNWCKDLLLKLDPNLQKQMFRFVDVLPSLSLNEQINNLLIQYFANSQLAPALNFAAKAPLVNKFIQSIVKFSIKNLAKVFICGSNIHEAQQKIKELKHKGQEYTLDLLGEKVLTDHEAKEYFQKYLFLIESIPQLNLSIKLSSLVAQINILNFKEKKQIIKTRLREIFHQAQKHQAQINIDSEEYANKDFYFEIIRELLLEPDLLDWQGAGIVIQAYLKDSKEDLIQWISFAKNRQSPISIRLVKGAYWDYEVAIAKQKSFEIPVFENKLETDANYEKLTEVLLQNYFFVRPAFASHNIRSLAHVLGIARINEVPKAQFEIQTLYGMADELKNYLAGQGYTTRVYLPYGELITGMSYLVRRLLENSANESFLKQGFIINKSEEELLMDPQMLLIKHKKIQENNKSAFVNSYCLDFCNKDVRNKLQKELSEIAKELYENKAFPLVVNSERVFSESQCYSINPSNPKISLGKISLANLQHCDQAIYKANEDYKKWSKLPVQDRAILLEETAKQIQNLRLRFIALLILEAGKTWIDADAEVSELIDFLNYYAKEAKSLENAYRLNSLSGEKNINHYKAHGVTLVISPWNFPLAIMGGMAAAALVTGNAVIIKPSIHTSIIAHEFINILLGILRNNFINLYPGLVSLLPGEGKTIGEYMIRHPYVKLIAFTGSNEVGKHICKLSAQSKFPKKVIAEMGGKNAIIVDDNADLDEAIPGIIHSVFGYAGQKCSACSRLIVHEKIYDKFMERFVSAVREIKIGDAQDDSTYMGPQIDLNAKLKIEEYINYGKEEARLVLGDLEIPNQGFFVSPTIFDNVPLSSKLSQEEIFGPVLCVYKARGIDEAIDIANSTQFGLTGALYSRSPENIDKAYESFEVGNLYINRSCVGAVVSRQAFGGVKNSSIGFKAGGPNYLLQFVQEKTITENTMRRGFVGD